MASNRSVNTYQKIDTIFKRDANNIIMPYDGFCDPSLEYFRQYGVKFDASEKIDGTSMRIEVTKINWDICTIRWDVRIKGKSDDAQIPPHLEAYMKEKFPRDLVLSALGLVDITPKDWDSEIGVEMQKKADLYTIYGEGYGVKIQKGGNYIPDGVGFIVFDVKVGDLYLLRENMYSIADKLNAPHVPYMGQFTIDEAIDFVRKGFKSTIAANKDYNAEGLVLTTPIGLKNRKGERIIFKIKTCDFIKYRSKYGTDDPVNQPVNEKYNRE